MALTLNFLSILDPIWNSSVRIFMVHGFCCDGGILCDEEDDLAKYSKDGEFKWRIGEDPSEPGVTCIRKFFVE